MLFFEIVRKRVCFEIISHRDGVAGKMVKGLDMSLERKEAKMRKRDGVRQPILVMAAITVPGVFLLDFCVLSYVPLLVKVQSLKFKVQMPLRRGAHLRLWARGLRSDLGIAPYGRGRREGNDACGRRDCGAIWESLPTEEGEEKETTPAGAGTSSDLAMLGHLPQGGRLIGLRSRVEGCGFGRNRGLWRFPCRA